MSATDQKANDEGLRNGEVESDQESQLLDAIERWVKNEVAPRVLEYDHADRYPHELVGQMKELGLFGATSASSTAALDYRRRPMPGS